MARRMPSLICGARESDAAVVVQGVDHVGHQAMHGIGADVGLVHLPRGSAQGGMAHADDLADGHSCLAPEPSKPKRP